MSSSQKVQLKLKLNSSPVTVHLLKSAYDDYDEVGLFWSSLILLTSCYVATDSRWLFMKFGYSGTGKTITDKIAIKLYGERLHPLILTGRFTPAGVAKLHKKSLKHHRSGMEFERLKNAQLIFVEDLSRATTHYLKLTSVQFLAGLTQTTHLDDLTSEGGSLEIKLGEVPKKAMLSGTPSDWEEISATSLYEEFIDRRSLTCIALMRPEEWETRENLAFQRAIKDDWNVILEWCDRVKKVGVEPYYGPMKRIAVDAFERMDLYQKLRQFKKFPENLLKMIDSLAEGHARINGRSEVLPEDYQVVNKLFSRFLITADMKKKELFLVEEIVRTGGYKTPLIDLVYRLRVRSKQKDFADMRMVSRTILTYASSSKYLTRSQRGSRSNPVQIYISPYLRSIWDEWRKEVEEVL